LKRRDILILSAGTAIAWPLIARAQQKAMPVIGWLSALSPLTQRRVPGSPFAAFDEGLNQTGYVEGKNVAIEYRWAEGYPDRLPELAADLVAQKVDVIVAVAGASPVFAAKRATSTIPIVFTTVTGPVELGLVASLARPGGNVTGFVSTHPPNWTPSGSNFFPNWFRRRRQSACSCTLTSRIQRVRRGMCERCRTRHTRRGWSSVSWWPGAKTRLTPLWLPSSARMPLLRWWLPAIRSSPSESNSWWHW
jgi:hypothetical protein